MDREENYRAPGSKKVKDKEARLKNKPNPLERTPYIMS